MPIIRILFLLMFFSVPVRAQYPFEQFKAPEYKLYNNWKDHAYFDRDDVFITTYSRKIPAFWGPESLTIQLACRDDGTPDTICIYKGKKLTQRIAADIGLIIHNQNKPIRVADINGDGLQDIKLMMNGTGCGLASMYTEIVYLFQRPNHRFMMISYTDMMDEHRPERDLDGDGSFEIITMCLKGHKEHNYRTFDVFNFRGNKLVNVNDKFNYPLMVQYLFRENYTPATLSKRTRDSYATRKPTELMDYRMSW